jgi:hypothetical protein
VDAENHPKIKKISRIVALQYQTITITGRGFGYNQPYDGDSVYMFMEDITGTWAAGCGPQYGPCGTTLDVTSWTDSQIVITGFTGRGQFPRRKDLVVFFVYNPQTGKGPSSIAAVVR